LQPFLAGPLKDDFQQELPFLESGRALAAVASAAAPINNDIRIARDYYHTAPVAVAGHQPVS